MNPPDATLLLLRECVPGPLRLVSTSQHLVFQGPGVYVKVARDTTAFFQGRIAAEHRSWTRLGHRAVLHTLADGRLTVELPDLGRTPVDPDTGHGIGLARALTRLHDEPAERWTDLPTLTLADTIARLTNRLGMIRDPELARAAGTIAASVIGDLTEPVVPRPVVCHGDPNLRNFVVDDAGTVHLVDLESTMFAGAEHDAATVALACATHDRSPSVWAAFRDELPPLDPRLFRSYLAQKTALTFAWAAWQTSMGNRTERDQMDRRLPLLDLLAADDDQLMALRP